MIVKKYLIIKTLFLSYFILLILYLSINIITTLFLSYNFYLIVYIICNNNRLISKNSKIYNVEEIYVINAKNVQNFTIISLNIYHCIAIQ
jgi:hypothetical protein